MQIKYFPETDTLLVMFNDNAVIEIRDIDENVNIDANENDGIVSMTIEHAKRERTSQTFHSNKF